MLRIFHGLAFSVSQSADHPRRRFPSDLSVRSEVPHRVSGLLEFVQDLGDESMPAFGGPRSLSLLARDIDPEFQRFGHPEFHMLALVLAIESLGQIGVLRIGRPRHAPAASLGHPRFRKRHFAKNPPIFHFTTWLKLFSLLRLIQNSCCKVSSAIR
jgi:hypothetical protein